MHVPEILLNETILSSLKFISALSYYASIPQWWRFTKRKKKMSKLRINSSRI